MKKRLLVTVAMTLLLCFAFVASASAEIKTIILKLGDPYMTVNGIKQEIDPGRGTKPVSIQGRTMVPIRTIIENMGGTIGWDGALQMVTMTANNKTVRVTVGYTKAEIKEQAGGTNWTQKTLDVAPQSIKRIVNKVFS